MTKFSASTLLLMTTLGSVQAFAPSVVPTKQQQRQQQRMAVLRSPASKAAPAEDRIKSAGGGIPLQPAGGFSLFDPSINGKISSCKERIALAYRYEYLVTEVVEQAPVPPEQLDEAHHFLEHIDGSPFAKASSPVIATCLGRVPLIALDAPGDVQHVLLELPRGFHYLEGQSISIIPPGIDDKTGKPYKPRLYSIASTRYGELLDGSTVSLCVRRAEYVDPVTGLVDPDKKGVCSNYLCDLTPGEPVQVAGPVGRTMLLPEDGVLPNTDLILVATGTGIAPFRGFLRRLFAENTVARHMYNGNAWLILGVPTTGGLLYSDEWADMMRQNPEQLQITYAISREMRNNQDGGKLYVQHVLQDNAETVLERLNNGAHIYFCGLKGMMPGILHALEAAAAQWGIDWNDFLSQLKKNGQWHVEVY